MAFTIYHPNGRVEIRQHIPYRLEQQGHDWYAYHATTGQKLGRFNTKKIAEHHLKSMTEPAVAKEPKQ
jgi:hypothetical protein